MDDILRIGKVQSLNTANRTVRVFFADINMMSGEMKVLKSPPFIGIEEEPKDLNKTKKEQGHYHELDILPWFPQIGDSVLCLYNPGFNEDGYVIGAL